MLISYPSISASARQVPSNTRWSKRGENICLQEEQNLDDGRPPRSPGELLIGPAGAQGHSGPNTEPPVHWAATAEGVTEPSPEAGHTEAPGRSVSHRRGCGLSAPGGPRTPRPQIQAPKSQSLMQQKHRREKKVYLRHCKPPGLLNGCALRSFLL